MKYSATILALFLGNTSALQIRAWDDVKKEPVNQRQERLKDGVFNPNDWIQTSNVKSFQHLQQQHKQDIGNSKYVRPDVYHFVNENIGQVPTYRRKTAPKHVFAAGKSGQGIEIVSSGPSAAGSLAQMHGDGEGEEKAPAPVKAPEKVVILQPLEYQHRANTNSPNLRTAFYAQQGLAQMHGDGEGEGEDKAPAPVKAPEKVAILQPLEYQHRANTNSPNLRTAFYAQQGLAQMKMHGDGEGEDKAPAPVKAPEKVAILQPLEYQHRANTNSPNLRTAFYAQQGLAQMKMHGDGEGEGEDKAPALVKAPEKVAILQPLEYQHRANTNTPNLRTAFYAQQEQ